MELMLIIIVAITVILFFSVKIVPQQEAWVVENFGKFDSVLQPGLNFIIPIVQNIAYKHTLKEQAIDINEQTAISKDNVSLSIDGVLYLKVTDPVAASYGVSNPYYAVSQLAQTTLRAEVGKIPLDRTFEERETLNITVAGAINQAAVNWGVTCLRHEVKNINLPNSVLKAMELQVAAERQKRAEILQSEGAKQSKINNAEAEKLQVILASEASYTEKINKARAESEALIQVATATAQSIEKIAKAINTEGGVNAVALKLCEGYIDTLGLLANKNNTMIIPANVNDPSSMIAQGLSVFKNISTLMERVHENDKKNKS